MTTPSLAPVKIARTVGGQRVRLGRETIWSQDGLAITRSYPGNGWTVTHVASGFALVQHITHRGNARKAALRFLPLADWTRSRTAVMNGPQLRLRARAVKEQLRSEGILS